MDQELLNAVYKNNIDIVRKLIDKGADINTQDTDGDRPLMLAIDNNNI